MCGTWAEVPWSLGCYSRGAGFRAGGFSLPSPSPCLDFCARPLVRAPQKSKMALDYRTERVFRDETPSNRLQAGYKRSGQFWLLIGARKPLYFSAQSQSSKTGSHFASSYTIATMQASCSPCLLEEKSSNHSTNCRGDRSTYPLETRRNYGGPFAGIVTLACLTD